MYTKSTNKRLRSYHDPYFKLSILCYNVFHIKVILMHKLRFALNQALHVTLVISCETTHYSSNFSPLLIVITLGYMWVVAIEGFADWISLASDSVS